jgi:hypothetical protein
MDCWYATKDLMIHIERLRKHYYCPLKSNRQVASNPDLIGVDDSNAQKPYPRVDRLQWSETKIRRGKLLKISGFPKHHKVL